MKDATYWDIMSAMHDRLVPKNGGKTCKLNPRDQLMNVLLMTVLRMHHTHLQCRGEMSQESASTSGRESTYDDVCRTLSRRWPGRQEQILGLLDYLWDPLASVPPLLVYGGPSTGKTAIVRCPLFYAGHCAKRCSLDDGS